MAHDGGRTHPREIGRAGGGNPNGGGCDRSGKSRGGRGRNRRAFRCATGGNWPQRSGWHVRPPADQLLRNHSPVTLSGSQRVAANARRACASIPKPVPHLYVNLPWIGVVRATEGLAVVQKEAAVSQIQCRQRHRETLRERLAKGKIKCGVR